MTQGSSNQQIGHLVAVAGATGAFALEYFKIVPSGAGSPVTACVGVVLHELLARALSPRERSRVLTAADIAADRINVRLREWHPLQCDEFWQKADSAYPPAQELFESALMRARDSFEEKKVRHFGLFLANFVFAQNVSSHAAHLLLKTMEALTYRQMCLISLIGAEGAIDVQNLRQGNHSDPDLAALRVEEMGLHSRDLGNAGLVDATGAWTIKLSTLGLALYELSGLNELDANDLESLRRLVSTS